MSPVDFIEFSTSPLDSVESAHILWGLRTRALDLSPKDAQQIKTAILNLEKEDAAGDDDEY